MKNGSDMDGFLHSFSSWVARDPARPAVCEGEAVVSYSELDRLSDALAAEFARRGIVPGQTVGCLKTRMTTAYVTALAGAKSGVGYLFLDAREGEARIGHVFALPDIQLLITDAPEGDRHAPVLRCDALRLDGLADAEPQRVDVNPRALCWLEPTSGSTGAPKLVQTPRFVLDHLITMQTKAAGFDQNDRIANFGELWCDTLLTGLTAGASYHAYDLRAHGTAPVCDWMRSNRITAVQTYVAAFRGMALACKTCLADLKRVRLAGEVVTRADVETFERITGPGALLMNFYGSTECGLISQYVHRHGAPRTHRILPIGQEIEGTEVHLVDELNRPVPEGITGLMLVRSRDLAEGYFRNPEGSKDTFWQEADGMRVLNTGDLAFRDEAGLLHIVGRADDQVKIRGFSVRYSEIEEVLEKHPTVQSALVTSFLSPRGQRQLSAHVILAEEQRLDDKALRQWLAEHLPTYMVPTYFVAHQDFPRTDTGKPLRRALPNPLDMVQAEPIPRRALSRTEAIVADCWRNILGHDGFAEDEDFFDCGGDSLQAMAMVVELETKLHVRIGYESLIMRGASVRDIAARIDGAAASLDRIITLKQGDGRLPIYVLPVENGEFSNWLYVMRRLGPDITLLGAHVRDLQARNTFARATTQALAEYAADSITAHDPDGPYVVAGYSAGAHTAFETARVLASRGKTVAGLILLDPPVKQLEPFRRTWHLRRVLSPLINQRDLPTSLTRAGHILLGTPTPELHIADEVTFWRYRPTPCAIPDTLLVSARDDNPHRARREAEWQTLLGGSATLAEAPGTHNLLMRDPNAPVLAQMLERWWKRRRASLAGAAQDSLSKAAGR